MIISYLYSLNGTIKKVINKRNRLLFLSQLIPYPPDAGPKVRSYRVLQHLATAGHQVTLLAFRRESDTLADIDHLDRYCTSVRSVLIERDGFGRTEFHTPVEVAGARPGPPAPVRIVAHTGDKLVGAIEQRSAA